MSKGVDDKKEVEPKLIKPGRITHKIKIDPKFEDFIRKSLEDDRLIELIAKNPAAALREAGITQTDTNLKADDLSHFYKLLIALREAAQKEEGIEFSYSDIFDAIFAGSIGKESKIADEKTGCHTGYNEGWSNSSGRTAGTNCGTHRIFRYDMTQGLLINPAEAIMLSTRLEELSYQFGESRNL